MIVPALTSSPTPPPAAEPVAQPAPPAPPVFDEVAALRQQRARQVARASRAEPTPKATTKPTREPVPKTAPKSEKAVVKKQQRPRATARQSAPPRPSRTHSRPGRGGSIATVIAYAKAQLGDPYVWGAEGPNAYDCSGLVMAAYAQIGVRLPHNAKAQAGRVRRVSRAQLRVGDLVFSEPGFGHVGIYVGGGKMIHAPQSGDVVKISAIYAFHMGGRLVG